MRIHDISMEIKEDMLTYPGNPKVRISRWASIPASKTNVSEIRMGSHTGTHVDSELHIKNNGSNAEELPLDSLYGNARVLDLTNVGKSVGRTQLERFRIRKGEILLLKTENSVLQRKTFRKGYAYVDETGARYLAGVGVKTLCVDYLSVKRFGKDDIVHRIVIENMTLFEGVDLSKVRPGTYTFVGLPLRIGCDGSPARAILIER